MAGLANLALPSVRDDIKTGASCAGAACPGKNGARVARPIMGYSRNWFLDHPIWAARPCLVSDITPRNDAGLCYGESKQFWSGAFGISN